MPFVKIRLELFTPIFTAGADAKIPELRAPSIKGMQSGTDTLKSVKEDIQLNYAYMADI